MGYSCKVLADSVSPAGVRLTTLEVTFPRFILAEVNTHRMLSRSSASSRAIPVEKRIAAIEADPFVPDSFGKNRKGMQASEDVSDGDATLARTFWLQACRDAIVQARALATIGVHKQLANRLLEPFAWHTAIITATEWSNFFALRCHPAAQPEFRITAELMRDALEASRPRSVAYLGWHLPYVDRDEESSLAAAGMPIHDIARVSCMRCARVSFLTHDGRRDPAEDLRRAGELIEAGHMSPFEHAAAARYSDTHIGNFRGWMQYRKMLRHEDDFSRIMAERGAAT